MGVLKVREPGGPWLPITGVGTNPGISQADADVRYVNITGDTMTGQLTVNRGPSQLGVAIVGDGSYIGFYDNTGNVRRGYVQGLATGLYLTGESGYIETNSAVRIGTHPTHTGGAVWTGDPGVNYMVLQIGGTVFMSGSSETKLRVGNSDYFTAGAGVNTSHVQHNINGNAALYFPAWGGGWNMSDGSYLRSVNDKHVWLGNGWYGTNGGICVGYSGVSNAGYCGDFNGSVRTGHQTTIDGCRITSNGGWGNSWGDRSFIAQKGSGGLRAGYTLHPGGIAKQIDCVPNDGNMYFHNEGGDWYCDIWCNTVSQASSIRGKTDVAAWPPRSAGSAVMDACNRLSLIDVVSYRIKPELSLIQAETMVVHDCDVDPCDGTSTDPCMRVKDQRNPQIGIVIEDLATVLPEAVAIDGDGNPGAMRLGSMIGYLLAVCKEQQERIETLEHHLEAA